MTKVVAAFESRLDGPIERFLAQAVEHGLSSELRSADDFLRHFSVPSIMRALSEQPRLRAEILNAATGLASVIGERKSPESSGEDLQIAIDEGLVTPTRVLELLGPDDRIRYLDNQLIWAYVFEPGTWTSQTREPDVLRRLREHTSYLIAAAMKQGLLSARDVITAISAPTLVDRIPRELIANAIERALEDGRQGTPFADSVFLELVPLSEIVSHVPLATLWNWVLGAKVGRAHGLLYEAEELFDWADAHPDAVDDSTRQVTVVVDPEGTAPTGTERESRSTSERSSSDDDVAERHPANRGSSPEA